MISRSRARDYAIAMLAVAAALGLRSLLDPIIGNRLPLATLFGAVAIAVWIGGYGPAIVATFVGYIAADYLFVTPRGTINVLSERLDLIAAFAYLLSCAVIIALGEGMLRARSAFARSVQQLQDREQRLENTLRSISDAFYTVDRDWRFTYINAQAERYFGKPRAAMLGQVLWELRPELLGSEAERQHRHALQSGVPAHFTYLSAASGRWLEVRSYPSAEGLAVFFLDVSDRKKAELALRDADRRKDEFLAVLAHELRNPLAPIGNSIEILKLIGNDPERREQTVALMDRQVKQMTRLIDDLLDIGRITTGKVELRKRVIRFADIIVESVETARPALERLGHEVVLTMPTTSPCVDVDPVRMGQVISNLLSNAGKFMEAPGRITVMLKHEKNMARLLVADTGIGIPTESLNSVFDMFVQIDSSVERRQGGLGIGLTLVKNLVESHGGVVEARSDGEGRGAEFIVSLPTVDAPSAADSVPGTPMPPSARRFLVVDDNPDSAESLAILLRVLGNDAAIAHSGEQALEIVPRYKPDVVLCDIGMPGMSGLEVARRLRAANAHVPSRLVALTGYGTDGDRERSRAAGFDSHLVKPVDIEKLQQLLQH